MESSWYFSIFFRIKNDIGKIPKNFIFKINSLHIYSVISSGQISLPSTEDFNAAKAN